MTKRKPRKVNALAGWYGANRLLAENVGAALAGRRHVTVLFAGGMSELKYIRAPTIIVCDRHRHILNLAAVVADADLNAKLRDRLDATPFHEAALEESQAYCLRRDVLVKPSRPDLEWAYHYFNCAWMARGGRAGTKDEFNGGFSVRHDAGGGDSAVRYRSAAASLADWQVVMAQCTYVCGDAFELLDKVKDSEECAIYADPPWVGKDGQPYTHGFSAADHARLAAALGRFEKTRVVVRYGDVPEVRALYPENCWTWRAYTSRTASNKKKDEALILNHAPGDSP